jgi:hypothetical protein
MRRLMCMAMQCETVDSRQISGSGWQYGRRLAGGCREGAALNGSGLQASDIVQHCCSITTEINADGHSAHGHDVG